MQKVIEKSEGLISFNEEMIINFKEFITYNFPYKIIPQSVLFKINNNNYNKENNNNSIENKEEELNLIYERLEIEKDKKIILFPAGMRKIKDPLFIIKEIINFLQRKNSEYICVLIGSIYDRNLYEEILNLTKNIKNFKIATSIEHKDFMLLLSNSKILLNSSINEGMSNVILESMSIGIPILARKNEGNCKLIKNNFNGFLFETPAEFLEKLEILLNCKNNNNIDNDNDNLIVKRFIENGKILIKEKFSFEVEKESYRVLIREIFSKYYFDYEDFNFFFSKNTHPFSNENNSIFDVKKNIIN
jgi:glycosyltransferase involved in cell wall biosynthesis